jgi:hypothetical protein
MRTLFPPATEIKASARPSAGQTALRFKPIIEEIRSRKDRYTLVNVGRRLMVNVGSLLTSGVLSAQRDEYTAKAFVAKTGRDAQIQHGITQILTLSMSHQFDDGILRPEVARGLRQNHGVLIFPFGQLSSRIFEEVIRHLRE